MQDGARLGFDDGPITSFPSPFITAIEMGSF
jgi:hypothetical protein